MSAVSERNHMKTLVGRWDDFRMFLPVTSFYSFTFYSVISFTHSLVNANGIPYLYAAVCDFVTLCDGPDDDHLIGRNMLSM